MRVPVEGVASLADGLAGRGAEGGVVGQRVGRADVPATPPSIVSLCRPAPRHHMRQGRLTAEGWP
jgi:hypothetical protein